jgi:hypothetical protein
MMMMIIILQQVISITNAADVKAHTKAHTPAVAHGAVLPNAIQVALLAASNRASSNSTLQPHLEHVAGKHCAKPAPAAA